jgi:hypothetical protein
MTEEPRISFEQTRIGEVAIAFLSKLKLGIEMVKLAFAINL